MKKNRNDRRNKRDNGVPFAGRLAACVLVAVLACGITWIPQNQAYADTGKPGEVIVCYRDPDKADLNGSEMRKAERALEDSEELLELGKNRTVALVADENATTEELIEEYSSLPNVECVEPNCVLTAAEGGTGEMQTEDYTSLQWNYGSGEYSMHVPDWNRSEKENAEGTVIAILDTGVDYTHEDLKNVMWDDGNRYDRLTELGGGVYGINTVEGGTSTDPMDTDCSSTHYHGTHCAGIVAAQWNGTGVSGAANGTEIMAVKVADLGTSISYDSILAGYQYILEAKKAGVNVVAINNSWGGNLKKGTLLQEVVTEAGQQGIVSVFASANSGADCDHTEKYSSSERNTIPGFLKGNPYKIVVNSITSTGGKAGYSNYGLTTTDLGAPGTGILSTVRYDEDGNRNGYEKKSGTSMSTPAVTAEAAVLSASDAELTAEQIARLIVSNTTACTGMDGKCVSGGTANVEKALSAEIISVDDCGFSLTQTVYTYNGKKKEPDVVNNRGLEEGKDYTVAYASNSGVGTARAVITGLGNCMGKKTLSFTIRPVSTAITGLSGGSGKVTVKWKKRTVQVTGYQLQYAGKKDFSDAETLRIKGSSHTGITVRNLAENRTYCFRIRTYKKVSGENCNSGWSKVKSVKTR